MTSRKRVWYFGEDDAPQGGWQNIPFQDDPTFDAVAESMEPRPDPPVDLWRGLASLTKKQRFVIELRYGLGTRGRHTLEECGEILNVTPQAVDQIERRAMAQLLKGLN